MVAGADHDQARDGRVCPATDPHPGPPAVARGVLLQHQRHPQRPAGVQGREGRELVGQAAQALGGRGVAAPPPVTGRQRQHVGVPAEQAGRRGREQQVGHQRDDRADQQRPAGGDVDVAASAVEPDQHDGGDDVVGGGVPEGAEEAQSARDGEELVDGPLPRQVEGALDVEQLGGATLGRAQGVAREHPRAAVGDVEGEDQDHLEQRGTPAAPAHDRCLTHRPGLLRGLLVSPAPHALEPALSRHVPHISYFPGPSLRRTRIRRGYRSVVPVRTGQAHPHGYQTVRRRNVHRTAVDSATREGNLHRICTTSRHLPEAGCDTPWRRWRG